MTQVCIYLVCRCEELQGVGCFGCERRVCGWVRCVFDSVYTVHT